MSEEKCATCRFFEAGRGYMRALGSDFIEMDRPIHGYAQKRVKGPVEGGNQIGPCRRYRLNLKSYRGYPAGNTTWLTTSGQK